MDVKWKGYGSIFLFFLVYMLTIQPIFPRVAPPVAPNCGQSKPFRDFKIVGGKPAPRGAWPWAVLLGFFTGSIVNLRFRCAGSILSPKTVVTAGHCAYNRTDSLKLVRLGAYHLNPTNDTVKPVDLSIKRTIVHPRYNPIVHENDIALIILDEAAKFTDFIRPICLPIPDDLRNRLFTKTIPIVAGWGSTHVGGTLSSVINQVQVPVVDTDTCKRDYKGFNDTVVDKRVICAGYHEGGKDSCQGDSGGPLMLPVNNTFYLIGIVSNGFKCAEPDFPGIYTRVTSFLDFITANLE